MCRLREEQNSLLCVQMKYMLSFIVTVFPFRGSVTGLQTLVLLSFSLDCYCNVIVIRGHACSARVSVQRSIGHQTKQVDNVEGCGPTSELLHTGKRTRDEASSVSTERCEVLNVCRCEEDEASNVNTERYEVLDVCRCEEEAANINT